MRPIDADTLLEKVEKIQPWDAYLSKYAQGIRHCMELVSLLIKDAPTIEPERKTGEWIFKGYGEYRCSSCRGIVDLDMEILMSIESFDYCPYCGSYNGGNTETE